MLTSTRVSACTTLRWEWEEHVEVCPRSPVEIQLKSFKRAVESQLATLVG